MSIEFHPSRNYPGRTDMVHKTYDDGNTSTIIALSEEDLRAIADHLSIPDSAELAKELDEAVRTLPEFALRDTAERVAQKLKGEKS